jgi:hypothetical protein
MNRRLFCTVFAAAAATTAPSHTRQTLANRPLPFDGDGRSQGEDRKNRKSKRRGHRGHRGHGK